LNEDLDGTFIANNYHATNANPTTAFFNFFLLLSESGPLHTR